MYVTLLFLHSWLRWIILSALVIVLVRAVYAYFNKDSYNKMDNVSAIILVATTHIQVFIGLVLYFLFSPFTTHPLSESMMSNSVIRYWKFEHITLMFIFLIVVQSARILTKKVANSPNKHKINIIFSLFAVLILLLGMPWPHKTYGRPLFRAESSVNIQHNQLFL